MKSNVTQGRTPDGLFAYLRKKGADAQILGGSYLGTTLKEIAKEFRAVVARYPHYAAPILHFSLRATKREPIAPSKWVEIVTWIMTRVRLRTHRLFVVVLDRKPDEHVHVAASRVDDGGKLWNDSFGVLKFIKATAAAEKHFKLELSAGLKEADPWRQLAPAATQRPEPDPEIEPKSEQDSDRHRLFLLLEVLVKSCRDWADFLRRAKEKKIAVAVHEHSSKADEARPDKAFGISFGLMADGQREDEIVWYRGSKIARAFSYGRIHTQLELNRTQQVESPGDHAPSAGPEMD